MMWQVWLPEIASKANKHIGTKSYHDLVQSKNNLVRKVFHRPPPKMSADFHEVTRRVSAMRLNP